MPQGNQPLNSSIIDKINTRLFDMHGRPISNLANAINDQDAVTKHDLMNNLAGSAYIDTTLANNVNRGILPNIVIPKPKLTALGGVKAVLPVTHQFVTAINLDGSVSQAQPDYSDLSGTPPAPTPTPSTQTVTSFTLNTTFQNTTSLPIFNIVTVAMTSSSSASLSAVAKTDNVNAPVTTVCQVSLRNVATTQVTTQSQLFFIVLPGNYYSITASGAVTLVVWTQWT